MENREDQPTSDQTATERAPHAQRTPVSLGLPAKFQEEWHNASYLCFSSSHKFCRGVCPVTSITGDDRYLPASFHANVIAMERGELTIADVAEDFVGCTQCGACELRCPNTVNTGDLYNFRTRTVDVVKAVRALAVDQGIEQPNWKSWNERTELYRNEPVEGAETPISQEFVAAWAEGLDLPIGGETILFCDCEAAFYRTSLPRAAALILKEAGVEFGLMREQWCCGGPALEMGYRDQARRFAEHNVADWRAAGAKRILVLDPHDYIAFTEDYPKMFGDDYDFEIVLLVELLAELIDEGRLNLTVPVPGSMTYHDACRLNKRKGIYEAPRKILRAVPGLDFKDVDHVTQWGYCSGGGGGLPIEKPEITEALSDHRIAAAAELEVDAIVSACVWSERPLAAAGSRADRQLEVLDLVEIVAKSAGLI